MRKLTDLAMNSNRLQKVPQFLRSLPELKTLDLVSTEKLKYHFGGKFKFKF